MLCLSVFHFVVVVVVVADVAVGPFRQARVRDGLGDGQPGAAAYERQEGTATSVQDTGDKPPPPSASPRSSGRLFTALLGDVMTI